jgi:hypothetical protein
MFAAAAFIEAITRDGLLPGMRLKQSTQAPTTLAHGCPAACTAVLSRFI